MTIIYSSSDLGSCIRSQVAARLGKSPLEPSDQTKEIWAAGHEWEGKVLDGMVSNGWVLREIPPQKCTLRPAWDTCNQVEVVVDLTSEIKVGAHLDGVGKYKTHSWETVIEVKSMGEQTWEKVKRKGWEAGGYFERYKWQTSVQQLGSGLHVIVACVNKKNGEVFFLNQEVPHYSKVDVMMRVLTVESWVRRGELPECDLVQYPCPFIYLGCGGKGSDGRGKAGVEVERLAREYKAAKLEEDGAGKKVARLRGELKKACGTEAKVGSDRVKVTWYMQRNPPKLDKEKVEKLGLKVEDVTTQGESERVRVEVSDEKS